jgi:hypothetical protein
MSSLSSLYRLLSQYKNFLSDVYDMINILNRSVDSSEASTRIGDYYTIDESTADNNLLKSNRNELIDKKSFLSGTIIPAINSKIREIERDIEREIERLAAEEDD